MIRPFKHLTGSGGSRRRPDACLPAPTAVVERARRYHLTYSSRRELSKRLTALHRRWNFALAALTTSSVVAGVVQLTSSEPYGERGPLLLAIVGVLVLVASLTVTIANFGTRAAAAFENYRVLQRISADLESLIATWGPASLFEAEVLERAYQSALDQSENHTAADFLRAAPYPSRWGREVHPPELDDTRRPSVREDVRNAASHAASALGTSFPIALCLGAGGLLAPVAIWLTT